MDNARSLLLISVVFNILALGALLLQMCSPYKPSPGICKIGIIAPPLTPEIGRLKDGIQENLPQQNYQTAVYHVESIHNQESIQAAIDQALHDGARLLIPIGRHTALAAHNATRKSKIPVVFCEVEDPVIEQLVDTPQVSGNHITGVVRTPADYGKFIDGMSILKPTPQKIVLIYASSKDAEEKEVEDFLDACRIRKIEAQPVALKQQSAHTMQKIKEIVHTKPDALMLLVQGFSDASIKEIIQLCKNNRVLLLCNTTKYVRQGAAISFGIDDYDVGKAVAKTVNTIIQQGIPPTKIPLHLLDDTFRFAVNIKLLKEQGITIPPHHLFLMQYGRMIA